MIADKVIAAALCVSVVGVAALPVSQARAGTDPYLGEVMFGGFHYCPRGWLAADGRLLRINQFAPLYAVLGTRYGGDGDVNFGLPDLRKQIVDPGGRDDPERRINACIAWQGEFPPRD